MPAVIAVTPLFQFTDSSGFPLVGGRLYTYEAGTTTPAQTWQDRQQIAANTNPILLNGRGECRIWLGSAASYKWVLEDPLGALIWTQDDITGVLGVFQDSGDDVGDAIITVKAPFTGSYATTQHDVNAREIWVEDFHDPAASDWTPAFNAAFAAAKAAGGAKVKAGRGTFLLNGPVLLQGNGTHFEGDGIGATILQVAQQASPGILVADSLLGVINDTSLRKFSIITALPATVPPVPLIRASNANGFVAEDIEGTGLTTGIVLAADVVKSRVWNCDLAGCTLGLSNLSTSPTNKIEHAPLSFRAVRITTPQTFTVTTATKVQFNAEYDPYATFDSVTNFRWTPGVIGTYIFNATVNITMPAATGITLAVLLYKNGAEVARGSDQSTAASFNYGLNLSTVERVLALGDYFEIFIVSTAVGTKTITVGSNFSGVKIN